MYPLARTILLYYRASLYCFYLFFQPSAPIQRLSQLKKPGSENNTNSTVVVLR